MAKLVSEVITQARYILGDTQMPYRYTQAELVLHVNSAVGEVKRVRPDHFDGTQDDDLQFVAEEDPFPLQDLLFIPCVFYVAGTAELTDDEHVNSSRAAGGVQRFYAALTSVI